MSWILRIICSAIGSIHIERQQSHEAGYVGWTMLQHNGNGRCERHAQLHGWTQEFDLQIGNQMLVLSLQERLKKTAEKKKKKKRRGSSLPHHTMRTLHLIKIDEYLP